MSNLCNVCEKPTSDTRERLCDFCLRSFERLHEIRGGALRASDVAEWAAGRARVAVLSRLAAQAEPPIVVELRARVLEAETERAYAVEQLQRRDREYHLLEAHCAELAALAQPDTAEVSHEDRP